MKKQTRNILFLILFIFIESVLYIHFIRGNTGHTREIEYFSIVICALFTLLITKKFELVNLGVILTLFADTFLVLIFPPKQAVGLTFFFVVQIVYAIYLLKDEKKEVRLANIISRCILSIVVFIVLLVVLKDKSDYLSIVSSLYIANLFVNVIFAFINIKKHYLFAIGLLLFLMCDIYLGLEIGFESYIPIEKDTLLYKIIYPGISMEWVFYMPSQVLIACYIYSKQN